MLTSACGLPGFSNTTEVRKDVATASANQRKRVVAFAPKPDSRPSKGLPLKFKFVASAAALALTLTVAASPARADEPTATAEAAFTNASRLNDPENLDFSPLNNGTEVIEGTETTVELSSEGAKSLMLRSRSEAISVKLPIPESVERSESEGVGTVFADNDFPGATVIGKSDGSVQIATMIDSTEAPSSFQYKIESNSRLQLNIESDGSVSIFGQDDNWIGGISAPWAEDASGGSVPTHYTVEGNTLTQHVDVGPDTKFPVVADPYLGMKLIKKTAWARKNNKYSPTLKVYPTFWGRTASSIARGYAWKETLAKTKRKGWPNPNTASMRNQFYCHFDFVRIRAPRKVSWNLDSKLPNRGYAGFIKKGCN